MADRNVLGGELEPCGTDPVPGFFRDGCCRTGPEDLGRHTICAVVTAEFIEHQRRIGNDLITPVPQFRFPGLVPGDRWCVTAANWLRAHYDGAAAYVVLADDGPYWLGGESSDRHLPAQLANRDLTIKADAGIMRARRVMNQIVRDEANEKGAGQ